MGVLLCFGLELVAQTDSTRDAHAPSISPTCSLTPVLRSGIYTNGFNTTVRFVNGGYRHVANFDLAAFYDTIDHKVLGYFLQNHYGLDKEFTTKINALLSKWTPAGDSDAAGIFHGHGIPQGPLASGLLSEVVLTHLDSIRSRADGRYLRYVDDIKIFGKTQRELRRRLVDLDLAAKEIGLVPQSAKINIREVLDPKTEIKTLSSTLDEESSAASGIALNRAKNLIGSRRREVLDNSKFKYYLARAKPQASFGHVLLKMLDWRPDLAYNVSAYLSKFDKLPDSLANKIADRIIDDETYHYINSELLKVVSGRVQTEYTARLASFARTRLFNPKIVPRPQSTYKAALVEIGVKHGALTFADLELIFTREKDWWVAKQIVSSIEPGRYGIGSWTAFMRDAMRHPSSDVAMMSAMKCIDQDVDLPKTKSGELNRSARVVLFSAGKIGSVGLHPPRVIELLKKMFDVDGSRFPWRRLFGVHYSKSEISAAQVLRNFESNIDASLVGLDSLCDLVYQQLFSVVEPGKDYGNYGGMLKCASMVARYPLTIRAFSKLHDLRLKSITAHPRLKGSPKPTRLLKFSDYYAIRRDVVAAFAEIMTGTVF